MVQISNPFSVSWIVVANDLRFAGTGCYILYKSPDETVMFTGDSIYTYQGTRKSLLPAPFLLVEGRK